jgi:hypothetical protein
MAAAKVLRFPNSKQDMTGHIYHGTPSTTLPDMFQRRKSGIAGASDKGPRYWAELVLNEVKMDLTYLRCKARERQ